jgi:hypothetical protein
MILFNPHICEYRALNVITGKIDLKKHQNWDLQNLAILVRFGPQA